MEATLTRLEQDFKQGNGPFADVQFPEERLLDELLLDTDEDKLQAISLFATLDYNRDANQLVDKILEIRDSHLLDPEYVASNEARVREVFDDVAFRYRNRDADAWLKNCRIITEKYDGEWSNLVADVGFNAPTLVARLNSDGFSVLKGVKVAPMYARIISDDVVALDNLWELDIPVDTHIRRLSKDLFCSENEVFRLGPEPSDDDIRGAWRVVAEKHDVDRAIVDGAMWHIGNQWDNWGENYWNEVTA